MTSVDTSAAQRTLTEEREKLIRQLDELGATETGELREDVEFGDGFADAGAATAERTEVLGIIETLKAQLDSVNGALHQISEGRYGKCDNCGRDISPARLAARPASILCVDCKSKLG
ncbi:MAG: TraR/DksA family transcriptional regulator [Acidimicrobiia bacterium]